MLSVIWGGAVLGILSRIFWLKAPRWSYVVLYIALGWAAVIYMGDLFAANPVTMMLVIVGGLSYTSGALFYAFKRPNPVPGVFGFHELFHTCTVIAFLCHWTGILLIAMDPIAMLATSRLRRLGALRVASAAVLGRQLPRAPARDR